MEFNIVSILIDRNPMLHLKRTGTYLKYVKKFWNTVFDTPLHDIDQFRMYLADKNRCNLSKRERAYAARCKEITDAVYATLVSEALDSETPIDIEEIERQAEKLLQTTPPFPIIIDLRESTVSPAVRRRIRFFRCGRAWIGVPKTARNWAAFEQLPRTNEEAG
ncbi:MAG: hypothetical protein IKK61_00035 [Clostridia bacterium]|nr:hypothetical protein [Clostridia bacterium]